MRKLSASIRGALSHMNNKFRYCREILSHANWSADNRGRPNLCKNEVLMLKGLLSDANEVIASKGVLNCENSSSDLEVGFLSYVTVRADLRSCLRCVRLKSWYQWGFQVIQNLSAYINLRF